MDDTIATREAMERLGLKFMRHRLPPHIEKLLGYHGEEPACAFYIHPKPQELRVLTRAGVQRDGNKTLFALLAERSLDITLDSLCGINGMTDGNVPISFVFERWEREGFYLCSAFQAHLFMSLSCYQIDEVEEAALEQRIQEINERFPPSAQHMRDVIEYARWVKTDGL